MKDLGERSYEDTKTALSKAELAIEQYLKDMEVSPGVFTAMMQVPVDDVRLFDRVEATGLFMGIPGDQTNFEGYANKWEAYFAPSVYDWLKPKCSNLPQTTTVDSCVRLEMWKESIRRAKRMTP